MADIILNNIYIVLLLPLWIFLIVMVGRFFSVYVNKTIIYLLTLFSSFFGALLTSLALWKLPKDMILEVGFNFIQIKNFIINCGLHVDRLGLIFALVLFLVSFLVQLFSISYMKEDKKIYRFYALLNLFNFSMLGLFFSPNLFQTYFFWEMVGVVSYFLIGFEYFKKTKSIASKRVFIINRIGDTAFLTGIILCSYFIFSYANNTALTTLSYVDMNIISTLVYAYTSTPLFILICGLFIIASIVKSAQFPFYTWLQDAMEAKLPVSALLHSATLVALGVFLILRLTSFFALESLTLRIISIIGLLTALICSLSACSQIHPKKALAYSTSAQLGLMFFAIGILNIKAAIAYFIAHAFIKSFLFLTLPKENEEWNFVNFILFLVGGLSLSGLIFSGMITKELIAEGLGSKSIVIFALISFLTAFYITRIALVTYTKQGISKQIPSFMELISTIGLLLLNIGYYLYIRNHSEYTIAEPFWAALTAWGCVYFLFIKNLFWKVPILYPLTFNGFYLDNFYNIIFVKSFKWTAKTFNFVDTRILANYNLPIWIAQTGVKTFNWVENHIMNNAVNIIKSCLKRISLFDSNIQTGNIQKYNAYAFIIITTILACLIFAYTLIISFIGG